MCEQTEINYLDGDVVWVKLGACWWPGQVTGFHNLPEDIQHEFQKKPLIAVVKFFQEDTYEFVKNYQQIYKYNCTQKEEFIKKGLDKYRSKSKDGSRYMDKFPGDIEMAEKLTGGDPDILRQEKFCPEEKPDISALFGDKKIAKKKKDRDDAQRRSDGMDVIRRITHPRFLKESDHEVRIRQQPSSLPSTPNSPGSPQYPCHLCSFTSSRVNVIICHIKSHKSGNSSVARSKVKSYTPHRNKVADTDTPKRKYVRKEKVHKTKNEYTPESGKRKQPKQSEKAPKKKKTDPKIRDTILADWDDESDDDDATMNQSKSMDTSMELSTLPTKAESDLEIEEELNKKSSVGSEIIEEAEKLLQETERLTSLQSMDTLTDNITLSKSLKTNILEEKAGLDKDLKAVDYTVDEASSKISKDKETEKEASNSDHDSKHSFSDKSDKKSLLSCFDFHEEEPSVPPVRKKGRAFHQKKEIIKEFEMSQALKNEQKERETEKNKPIDQGEADKNNKKYGVTDAQISSQNTTEDEVTQEMKTDSNKTNDESTPSKKKAKNEVVKDEQVPKDIAPTCETQLEIVEIFEVEREENETENSVSIEKSIKDDLQENLTKNEIRSNDKTAAVKNEQPLSESKSMTDDKQLLTKDTSVEDTITEAMEQASTKETEESLSERLETEDETVSESAETIPEQSENSDADMLDPDQVPSKETNSKQLSSEQQEVSFSTIKKRRGRPRKKLELTTGVGTDPEHSKTVINKNSQTVIERLQTERRTSESDTERSYTGRKRKPNKKYLESDIYVQDIDQRTFKTDESQSEGEDRSSDRAKGKTKRGRKSSGPDKKKTETIQDIEGKELQITQTLDAFDSTTVVPKHAAAHGLHDTSLSEDKMFVEENDKVVKSQTIVQNTPPSGTPVKHEIATEDTDALIPGNQNLLTQDKISPTIDETHLESLEVQDNQQSKKEIVETLMQKCTPEKELSETSEITRQIVDMLPPKKSQIKKFELSQHDFFEDDTTISKGIVETGSNNAAESTKELVIEPIKDTDSCENVSPILPKTTSTSEEADFNAGAEQTSNVICVESEETQTSEGVCPTKEKVMIETSSPEKSQLETSDKLPTEKEKSNEQQVVQASIAQTKSKEKSTEINVSVKKGFSDEKAINTFQEAFLKTLHMDKKKLMTGDSDPGTLKGKRGKKVLKKKPEDNDKCNIIVQDGKASETQMEISENVSKTKAHGDSSQASETPVLKDTETEGSAKVKSEVKVVQENVGDSISLLGEANTSKSANVPPMIAEDSRSVSQAKGDESRSVSTRTSSPSSDATIPVKKREMPRIIENVTLTEPMQILKSKLLDKMPPKGVKHKLHSDTTHKGEQKGSPKAKIMKIESVPANSKSKSGQKILSSHLPLTKKLQLLKADDVETTAITQPQAEQLNVQSSQPPTSATGEKYIQQGSQSLAEMELDINSMPFVLSDDVLTPESIEQMPVVISSIIPAPSTMPETVVLTPTTQTSSLAQTQIKASESPVEPSPTKKKSGTPAILKTKNKAKPTITSIKTIVPPLTGGVKGIKFQNTQSSKATPLLAQKGTPGKYVVVQTAGGQQLRYAVQGKSGTQQKIAIPAGKGTANAQLVQQGGKVVILTSAQSGQTKMLPLNITKTIGGKVQRIVTNKGQVLCSLNPQSIISSKTVITPKGDGILPTTSKLAPSHKIINTQGIITSKGVLTPIPESIAKSGLLGTLPQGIITKGGIYTPISASALSGKTIITSKSLMTKGTTILSPQSLGTSKAILTSISPTIAGKTILSTQGLVTTKGTVLTPITGQQVKAIAAKSPSKGGKVQYQSVQQKVHLPILQKTQKIAMSPSAQGKHGQLRGGPSTLVVQSASHTSKNVLQGKKVMKQPIIQPSSTMQNIVSQSSTQQTVGMVQQIQQKGKITGASTVQKVIVPRGGGRQTKSQQKIVVQKIQEPSISTVQNIQTKQTVPISPGITSASKGLTQQKHIVGSTTTAKTHVKTQTSSKGAQQQKNLLHVAMNAAVTTNVNASVPTTLSLPTSEPSGPEKKPKLDHITADSSAKEPCKTEKLNVEKRTETEKHDEPKVAAQPQIMALPTESSDGTQTYVLVTIDEQGQIQPLDNNALMSLEGTTQNPDGTRTLYIDPSSLGEAGTIDNIVLQFDNGGLPNIQTTCTESVPAIISESFQTSDVIQSSNQDILAAALANTDFQQEINLPENPAGNVMNSGLTQTSLINQTILQSTIIPPTDPISSPSVLETSLTLNQPIMTPLEVPSSLPIQSQSTPTTGVSTIPSSLELPITITNPNISYISAGETQIQIPANSMPDIGGIIENPTAVEIAPTESSGGTQYLVIQNLEGDISVKGEPTETNTISMPNATYSVSIPSDIVLQTSKVQTTPSMPIIDDTFVETFSTTMKSSIPSEQTFVDASVSEMLVPKSAQTTKSSHEANITPEILITSDVPISSQDSIVSTNESTASRKKRHTTAPLEEIYSSQEVPISSEELILQQTAAKEDNSNVAADTGKEEVSNKESTVSMNLSEHTSESMTSSMPIIDESSLIAPDSNIKMSSVEHISFEVTDSSGIETDTSQESKTADKFKLLSFSERSENKVDSQMIEERPATSNEVDVDQRISQAESMVSNNPLRKGDLDAEVDDESPTHTISTVKQSDKCQRDEPSSHDDTTLVQRDLELQFDEANDETSHETPSQSYNQFGISMTSSADLPSQSALKSENSREPTQSVSYEQMETDEEPIVSEPPTQSFQHSKINEASQSYESSEDASTNAPTQSFNEVMQNQKEGFIVDEVSDDQTFPTQSYEVDKASDAVENMDNVAELSQEGNIPSQSNDIGVDGIGTSSVSTNNSGLNEDETASSSYVPETPENQERDQDQESAISTSSYEIPPCEELNIGSSSVIPDTSIRAEHTSIHDNGVPEIPTSSYNLNPDISSTHVDSIPTSSYEDQVIVEQNVSTSYEVPMSMPGLEETCSQNFVTESSDHRNEPSSYYGHNQEVTASYYEPMEQESNTRLDRDSQEEATPSYYESNQQEASQSYFHPEEASQSYSGHNVSASYYDPRPEGEASQSYYSTDDMEKTEQSTTQNIEASQSFYQEQTEELKLQQQGEATPTYSERYPVDYTLDHSPIERHDLVESSVPATRPMER